MIRRLFGSRSTVDQFVVEASQRMVDLIALQVRAMAPYDTSLELAQLLAELADCEVNRLVLVNAGH